VRIAPESFDSDDARALRAELAEDIASRYGRDTEPGVKPTAGDITLFLVARDDSGTPVGCGALRALGDGAVEIKRMYVRPAARGTGVGRALLRALEAEAAARGFADLRLETGTLQHEAIGLYEAAGYAPIHCWGAYAGVPTSRCFGRRLSPAPPDTA
jgi:GNAT superfamily N-acetyltransferase